MNNLGFKQTNKNVHDQSSTIQYINIRMYILLLPDLEYTLLETSALYGNLISIIVSSGSSAARIPQAS